MCAREQDTRAWEVQAHDRLDLHRRANGVDEAFRPDEPSASLDVQDPGVPLQRAQRDPQRGSDEEDDEAQGIERRSSLDPRMDREA